MLSLKFPRNLGIFSSFSLFKIKLMFKLSYSCFKFSNSFFTTFSKISIKSIVETKNFGSSILSDIGGISFNFHVTVVKVEFVEFLANLKILTFIATCSASSSRIWRSLRDDSQFFFIRSKC